MIEKHFTLDRTMEGPDHVASLEPGELLQQIRNIELALSGSGVKAPSSSNLKYQHKWKSIHLNRNLTKNEVLTEMI